MRSAPPHAALAAGLLPLLLAHPAFAREGCEEPLTLAGFERQIEAAEASWKALDAPTYTASLAELRGALPCLSEPLGVPEVGQLFRLLGLEAFLERDLESASAWFGAARAVQPGYALPTSLIRPGNPARALYEEAQAPGGSRALGIPLEGELRIDGSPSLEAPTGRAWFFQRLDAGGAVAQSALLAAGDPPPAYESTTAVNDGRLELRLSPLRLGLLSLRAAAGVNLGQRFQLSAYGEYAPSYPYPIRTTEDPDRVTPPGYQNDADYLLSRDAEDVRLSWWDAGLALRFFSLPAYRSRWTARWLVSGGLGLHGYRWEGPSGFYDQDWLVDLYEDSLDPDRFLEARWIEQIWVTRFHLGGGREWRLTPGWVVVLSLSLTLEEPNTGSDKRLGAGWWSLADERGELARSSSDSLDLEHLDNLSEALYTADTYIWPQPALEIGWRF
jgi:hypothetical protein